MCLCRNMRFFIKWLFMIWRIHFLELLLSWSKNWTFCWVSSFWPQKPLCDSTSGEFWTCCSLVREMSTRPLLHNHTWKSWVGSSVRKHTHLLRDGSGCGSASRSSSSDCKPLALSGAGRWWRSPGESLPPENKTQLHSCTVAQKPQGTNHNRFFMSLKEPWRVRRVNFNKNLWIMINRSALMTLSWWIQMTKVILTKI